ncbi:MAG: DUF5996 family protein [Hyphomicrobiaceae bacterium]
MSTDARSADNWPDIPYPDWRDTCSALHLFCQIVGKYRLAHAPWLNHSWHATLYVTPEGLTTGPIPDGDNTVSLLLDLRSHRLVATASGALGRSFDIGPMSVAQFHEQTKQLIESVGGEPAIHGAPNEVPNPVPFASDTEKRPYDAAAVERFHRALVSIDRIFSRFRTGFIGKSSPVHLFWGSFDLAGTRFSGRRAPIHPGGIPALPDAVTREAYSHEVSSAGFWPGGGGVDEATFYSYAYPVPPTMKDVPVRPPQARFHEGLGEFVLPYADVRRSADPDATLLDFLQSTYEAAAGTAQWNRAELECDIGRPLIPRPI